ncbi:MAG: helix-turn-helix domain-containing protein [Conexibacter sp.]
MPPHTERERRVVGSAVRRMRKARRLTQEQVADGAGLGRKQPGQLERAAVDVRLGSIILVAEGLGMRRGDFFREVAAAFDAAEKRV